MVVLAKFGVGDWSPQCWGWSPSVTQLQEHAQLKWVEGLAGIGPRGRDRGCEVRGSIKSVLADPNRRAVQKQLYALLHPWCHPCAIRDLICKRLHKYDPLVPLDFLEPSEFDELVNTLSKLGPHKVSVFLKTVCGGWITSAR
eukprot:7237097-Karenia_brevis.AAC.1